MVTLTDIAAEKVNQFMEGQGAEGDVGLRVGVRGGGCSGFQYALALDERRDDDHVFDVAGIPVLVEPERGGFMRLRFLVPGCGRRAELRHRLRQPLATPPSLLHGENDSDDGANGASGEFRPLYGRNCPLALVPAPSPIV